ncbi:hypothetical protein L596_024774 [Steinernema carpocapsae]|uniref:Uncharacterized protein n=1 Tax=Steinernema carpocapsae TaxID=34508 RepID=A0A4U5M5Q6_STECR|nr:hypothetical protein L596_024774 [Steinernema carpocapsae]
MTFQKWNYVDLRNFKWFHKFHATALYNRGRLRWNRNTGDDVFLRRFYDPRRRFVNVGIVVMRDVCASSRGLRCLSSTDIRRVIGAENIRVRANSDSLKMSEQEFNNFQARPDVVGLCHTT